MSEKNYKRLKGKRKELARINSKKQFKGIPAEDQEVQEGKMNIIAIERTEADPEVDIEIDLGKEVAKRDIENKGIEVKVEAESIENKVNESMRKEGNLKKENKKRGKEKRNTKVNHRVKLFPLTHQILIDN